MSFVLRIFFSGLIAFAPSPDGKELNVLLLNAEHEYHASDGTSLEPHKPMLLARAGSCAGQCPTEDSVIAQFLFPDKPPEQGRESLAVAVLGGGAWQLSGSELSLRKASGDANLQPPLVLQGNVRKTEDGHLQAIPTTPQEREDFSWVADIRQINPAAGGLNPDVLSVQPPSALIAARLRLRSGRVFTYSLVQIDGKVKPIHFLPLGGEGTEASYTQALANWVAADIQVQGDTIEMVEENFGGGTRRSMTLSPRNGLVEMAVLNLPSLQPPSSASEGTPQPGKHFELYFDLAKTPPLKQIRPVPQVKAQSATIPEPEVDWQILHPREALWSDLLDKIRLGIGRGPYDRVICPMGQFSGASN
jgi:hypothetical protein